MTKAEFVKQITQEAIAAQAQGALFNKPVAIAQAALESNWGNSDLARQANNLFAIKAGNSWRGETVRLPGTEWHRQYGWYHTDIEWRKYPNWAECIADYATIIAAFSWYQDALRARNDSDQFLLGILPRGAKPGWATDPDYYQKVLAIAAEVESYGGPKWNT